MDELAEHLAGVVVTAGRVARRADPLLPFRELFVDRSVDERPIDRPAVRELRAVTLPLPDLRTADLGGCRILHQIEQRHAADAAQPGLDIADRNGGVGPEAGLGALPRRDDQKIGGRDVHVIALAINLVGLRHVAIEDLTDHADESGMSDPRAVMAVARFALLVHAHARHGPLVRRGIVLDRDESGHAADRGRVSTVASLDRQQAAGAQEMRGHRYLVAIRQYRIRIALELLDKAEYVIPAAAIEPSRVIA